MAGNREDPNLRGNYDPRGSSKPARPLTYQKIKEEGPAQPETSNEAEDQKLGIKIKTLLKGDNCEISVRSYIGADGRFEPEALCLFGPTDSMIDLNSDGRITLCTGKRTKERGGSSGKFNINANGGLHTYNYPLTINYNSAGEKLPSYAVGIVSNGDYKETTYGERHIVATKLYIEASDIIIKGNSSIQIQSGIKGTSGSIKMTAGRFEQEFINEDKIIFGQKTQTGAGEDTTITFDPRSTTTLTSAGTLQHRITGDYKIVVAGVMATSVYGASPTGMTGVPLITDRTHGYSLDVLLGKTRILNRVGSIDISALGLGTDEVFDPTKLLKLPVGGVNLQGLMTSVTSSLAGGLALSAGQPLALDAVTKLVKLAPGLNFLSKDIMTFTAGGAIVNTAGLYFRADALAGAVDITSSALTTISGRTGMLISTVTGDINVKALTGEVRIQGTLIYLN